MFGTIIIRNIIWVQASNGQGGNSGVYSDVDFQDDDVPCQSTYEAVHDSKISNTTTFHLKGNDVR